MSALQAPNYVTSLSKKKNKNKKGNKKSFISVSSRKTFEKQLDKAIDFHSGTHLTDNTVSS